MTDKDLGLKVFRSFYEWNKTFNPTSFNISFDAFLKSYGPKIDIYLDGVGGGVKEAGVSSSRIETAMRSLAMNSKGKIPSDYQIYFKYLQNEAVKINWVDAIAYTALESAKDIASGAEQVGKSIITTGKILNFLLPAIALVFVFFWINKSTEGTLTNAIKGLRKK